MKKREKIQYTIFGMVLMLLLFGVIKPALAGLVPLRAKVITVYDGVDVYVNDELARIDDINGNTASAFVYEGRTYIPIASVAKAFDLPVQWDGANSNAYIGKHTSNTPAIMLGDMNYFTGNNFYKSTTMTDNLGKTRTNCIYRIPSSNTGSGSNINNTYKLNGQYTRIAGTLFQNYEYRSNSHIATLEIYGDDKLLYTAQMTGGIEPIDFSVDLTGVLELRVALFHDNFIYAPASSAAISECGLYT